MTLPFLTSTARRPIARSGVPEVVDPGDDALLETVTLRNWSGTSVTDPYVTFRRTFEEGDVPAGSKVEMRYGGVAVPLHQADATTLHSDGSLRHATFSAKVPAGTIADNGTASVALWKVDGSFSNSTAIARSTLTTHDYKLRAKIGGVDYWCRLNHLDAAGTYREERAGAACRAWHHWGPFRAGTASSSTDHGQLQARFLSIVWEDGTVTIWPDMINGRDAAAASQEIQEFEFYDGVNTLYVASASFTAYAHACYAAVATGGLPHWSQNFAHVNADVSALYMHDKKLVWHIQAGPIQIADMGAGTPLDHAPNQTVGWSKINGTGGAAHIGVITQWSALALLSGQKTHWRNDRVQALAQGWMSPDNFVDMTTGYLPTLTNQTYTGLGTARPGIGWGVAKNITDTGTFGPLEGGVGEYMPAMDMSHGPNFAYFQYITTGGEWWLHRLLSRLGGSLGSYNPGTGIEYSRNPLIGGTQYYGSFCPQGIVLREGAWGARDADNLAWVIPDNNLNAEYVRDIRDVTFATAQKQLEIRDPLYDTLAAWPGMVYGSVSDIAYGHWMSNYFGLVAFQAMNRGSIPDDHKIIEHVTTWAYGAILACPYNGMAPTTIAIRQGSAPTLSSPIATSWDQVYFGGAGLGQQIYKLISDENGVSGSCPTSGQSLLDGEPYPPGHGYASIAHASASIANIFGLPNAAAVLVPLEAREAGLGYSGDTTAWNNGPQWRIRAP